MAAGELTKAEQLDEAGSLMLMHQNRLRALIELDADPQQLRQCRDDVAAATIKYDSLLAGYPDPRTVGAAICSDLDCDE